MFITDTHPLLWFANNKRSNLSAKVLENFRQAQSGDSFIYIPIVVFWEIALLEKAGKVKLENGFKHWASVLSTKKGFAILPLEISTISTAVGYRFNNDPFDNLIVASAVEMELPLITKDIAIAESNLVEIYW